VHYLASNGLPASLLWLAQAPDVLIILLCCAGACLAALPVARATGLVRFLASRERKLTAQLDALAHACSALATTHAAVPETTPNPGFPARFRPVFGLLSELVSRQLPPHETFAAASVELDRWLTARTASRHTALIICRAGPAIALGTALGTILLMAEVWANPAAMGSGAALGIGLMVLTCILALSVLSSAANWLEEAERADYLAVGVVLESARMITSGGTASDVARRTDLILRPRTVPAEIPAIRKAA